MDKIRSALQSKHLRYFMIVAALLALSIPAFAQTPVPIVVNTNAIFTQANSWITVFAPIMAIGIGIAIAIAILTFVGQQILKAFRS